MPRYANFPTLDAFDDFREALWVRWHAVRSAQLAAAHPERGHTVGGPLDYQKPRATLDRSSRLYEPGHPLEGQPLAPSIGRAGGLVWHTTCAPGCADHQLIPHSDGGDGGVLPIEADLEALLAAHHGAAVALPLRAALRAEANPRSPLLPAERRARDGAQRDLRERRARLLLGHRVLGVRLATPRTVVVDQGAAVVRDALPLRARATLDARDAADQAARRSP